MASEVWFRRRIDVRCPDPEKGRNSRCYLATSAILQQVPELRRIQTGVLNLYLLDSGASLSINENADPTVRTDMDGAVKRMAESGLKAFSESENKDKLPESTLIKSSLFGRSLTLPVSGGSVVFGTWQGIYLCSWDSSTSREILVTVATLSPKLHKVASSSVSVSSRGVHNITPNIISMFGLKISDDEKKSSTKKAKYAPTESDGAIYTIIRHTSASMGIAAVNEGWCETLDKAFDTVVPERWNDEFFIHTYEGPDDMPGHVKSSLFGVSAVVPVKQGSIDMSDEVGVVLGEHRDVGGWGHSRRIAGIFMQDSFVLSKSLEMTTGICDVTDLLNELTDGISVGWCSLVAKSGVPAALVSVESKPLDTKQEAGAQVQALAKGLRDAFDALTDEPGIGLAFAGRSLTIPIEDDKLVGSAKDRIFHVTEQQDDDDDGQQTNTVCGSLHVVVFGRRTK